MRSQLKLDQEGMLSYVLYNPESKYNGIHRHQMYLRHTIVGCCIVVAAQYLSFLERTRRTNSKNYVHLLKFTVHAEENKITAGFSEFLQVAPKENFENINKNLTPFEAPSLQVLVQIGGDSFVKIMKIANPNCINRKKLDTFQVSLICITQYEE